MKNSEFDSAVSRLSPRLRDPLLKLGDEVKDRTWEIRLVSGKPVMLNGVDGISFVSINGRECCVSRAGLLTCDSADIESSFARLCEYSLHSHEDDIRNGFLTAPGGHRAGFCGTAVTDNGRVTGVRSITSVNLRIARENTLAAEDICSRLFRCGLKSVIVAGAPSTGKTTVLRDLARRASDGSLGRIYRTSVADERGELSVTGGVCCDVFTGYPKSEAMLAALRLMSPEIIVCDEISDERELAAVRQSFGAGVKLAVSVHAADITDFFKRPVARALLLSGAFDYAVFLKSGGAPCVTDKIYRTDDMADEIRGSCHDGGYVFNDRNTDERYPVGARAGA